MPKPRPYTARDGSTTWRVRFRHRGRETSETFATEREAEAFASDVDHHGAEAAVTRLEAALEHRNAPSLDTVAELWANWKTSRVRSDRTIVDYRRDYYRSISPTLGSLPITAITDVHVQQLIDSMAEEYAPKTVGDRHAILHGILSWATSASGGKIIDANPAVGTSLPKRAPSAPKALTTAEWWALHAALRKISPDAADLATFMLHSGWRWSEAVALDRWNLEPIGDGTRLRVTMSRIARRNGAGATVIVGDAKAQASLRTITLDRDTSQLILARLDDSDSDLVFSNKFGRKWNHGNFLRDAWNPAITAANLNRKPTPHWLRHTHVVWSVRSGASLAEVQSRIGHASISTTIGVYGRALTDVSDTVLEGFAALATPPALGEPPAITG